MIFDKPAKRYMFKKLFKEQYKRNYDVFSLTLYQDIYYKKTINTNFLNKLIEYVEELKPEMLDYVLADQNLNIEEYKDICNLISIKGDNNE